MHFALEKTTAVKRPLPWKNEKNRKDLRHLIGHGPSLFRGGLYVLYTDVEPGPTAFARTINADQIMVPALANPAM